MNAPTGHAHPAAKLFPTLAPDELAALAASITEVGLLRPIVLDQDGNVLDGRNRLAVCELAGVEPTFTTYDGKDPYGYVMSVNYMRRNLTKGQIAMIAATAKSLGTKQTGWQQHAAHDADVSTARISQANLVLKFAPELGSGVIAGAIPLDDAYAAARERKAAVTTREQEAAAAARALARIHAEAPDLADMVTGERISLTEARHLFAGRVAERRATLEQARSAAQRIVTDIQCAVAAIGEGVDLGAADLITSETVDAIHNAADTLEKMLRDKPHPAAASHTPGGGR